MKAYRRQVVLDRKRYDLKEEIDKYNEWIKCGINRMSHKKMTGTVLACMCHTSEERKKFHAMEDVRQYILETNGYVLAEDDEIEENF